MATRTEFRNYLSGLGYTLQAGDPKDPIYYGDTWCFCTGDDGISYDAIQIGQHSTAYVGSSLADSKSQDDSFWTGTYTDSFPRIYLEVSCKYYINFPENTVGDFLIAGGGGGGGYDRGGGGGAGACSITRNMSLGGEHTIKVGKGGVGQTSTKQIDGYYAGQNGLNSYVALRYEFYDPIIYEAKGGGGGAQHINNGRDGGCGGGAGSQSSTHTGGTALTNKNLTNEYVTGTPQGTTHYWTDDAGREIHTTVYGSSGGSTLVNYTGTLDNLDGAGGGGIGENGQDKTAS